MGQQGLRPGCPKQAAFAEGEAEAASVVRQPVPAGASVRQASSASGRPFYFGFGMDFGPWLGHRTLRTEGVLPCALDYLAFPVLNLKQRHFAVAYEFQTAPVQVVDDPVRRSVQSSSAENFDRQVLLQVFFDAGFVDTPV